MEPEIEKLIKEQMQQLPEEIRRLFLDPELGNKLLGIGRENGIVNIEQLGILQTETYLVMLSLVHPDEYVNELKERLNIDNEKANKITKEVNEKIFKDVREKLKEIYKNTNSEDTDFSENNIEEKPKIIEDKEMGLDLKDLESREEMLKAIEDEPSSNIEDIFLKKEDLAKQKELPKGEEKAEPVKTVPTQPTAPEKIPEQKTQTPKDIFTQKFSGTFQMPKKETEHSLNNLTKKVETPSKLNTESKNIDDPYREPIE